jgi:GMP synthase-like glutamine amidotransferase
MHLHYLQHVPFEWPGRIAAWAADREHDLTGTHLFDGESLPSLDAFDWLIVMGGPMSVHDEATHPWLVDEKRLIRRAIDAGKPVLGICLGAQLIADVLGADITQCDEPEIGWFPVEATEAATASPLFYNLPDTYDVLHWHGETFDLPAGAVRMASSAGCENQAFVFEDRVVGLQFHLESTPETVRELVANDTPPDTGKYVQTDDEIRTQFASFDSVQEWLTLLLDNLERTCNAEVKQ